MNTLYVHIGTSKTATTAIQSFCIYNRKLLNQKGYDYPDFPYRYKDVSERRNGHFLIAEDTSSGRTGNFWAGIDRILHLFQAYPNIILSDEAIWSAPYQNRIDMWKALRSEAKENGFQVKIIVYLRRQDTYLISGWNQMVKSGIGRGAVMAWEDYVAERADAHKLNYATHLKKLSELWGRQNLIVRRFEPKHFIGGSIHADFLDAAGLKLTNEYKFEAVVPNLRLAGNTHEIKRVLNNMPNMTATYDSFFRRALLSFTEASGSDYPNEMFSKAESKAYMDKFADENRKTAQEYFGETELFDLKWKDIPKWQKDNPHMQDDLIRFVGACCMQLLEENKKLRHELDDLKDMVRHPLRTARQKRAGAAKQQ